MSPDLRFTLDVGQLVLLATGVWGLSQMSNTLKRLKEDFGTFVGDFKVAADKQNDLTSRVRVLEDRQEDRRKK